MIALATLRTQLRRHLATDDTDLPDSDADLLLNRTYWELQEKFHLRETEASTTITTVAGTREYTLPASFESLRLSSYVDPDTDQHTKLEQMSQKTYEDLYNADAENESAPTNYFRDNDSIFFWPTPDAIVTIVIWHRAKLDDLSVANTEPQLPRSWQEMLLIGAVYRGFMMMNDYTKANAAKSHYIQLIQSAVPVESKEQEDYSTAGVSVRGREY